jgi:hypothetical protein
MKEVDLQDIRHITILEAARFHGEVFLILRREHTAAILQPLLGPGEVFRYLQATLVRRHRFQQVIILNPLFAVFLTLFQEANRGETVTQLAGWVSVPGRCRLGFHARPTAGNSHPTEMATTPDSGPTPPSRRALPPRWCRSRVGRQCPQ